MPKGQGRDTVNAVMHQWGQGDLYQYAGKNKPKGDLVTRQKQAIAIALSEAGMANKAQQARKPKRVVPGSTAKARREGASGGLGKSGGGGGGGGAGGW